MRKIFSILIISVLLSCDNPFLKKKRKIRYFIPESRVISTCIENGSETNLDKLDVKDYCKCLSAEIKAEYGELDIIALNEAFIEKDYKTIQFIEGVVDVCADRFIY